VRIWIVGGGSIGLLLAADLAVSGCDVVLVVRTDEQARAIGGSGVTVRQVGRPDVRVRLRAFAFEEASAGAGAGKPDWIVPAVKQYDLDDRFVQVLGSWVTQHGRVCAIQNGLGHEQKLMKTIPPERLRVAVTTVAARRRSFTEVERTGTGITWMGRADRPQDWDGDDLAFAEALRKAGWPCEPGGDMRARMWDKLVVNCLINPITAVLGVENGRLLEDMEALSVLRDAFEEAVRIARAEGVRLSDGLWEAALEVCRKTALNRSSMLQDLDRGRKTEIDALTGALLEAAERRGVDAPVNRTLHRLVRMLERRARPETEGRS